MNYTDQVNLEAMICYCYDYLSLSEIYTRTD